MICLRRRLAWFVCAWLACQLAGVAATPLALSRLPAAHGDQECDCPLDAGATCPMHHSSSGQDGSCRLRNGFGHSGQALFALNGGSGVLPPSTVVPYAFQPGAVIGAAASTALARSSVPDAPPPRR
jgi:hypothetical protein